MNPLVRPALTNASLTFTNAAVAAGVAPAPGGYRARWGRFDNTTGVTTPLAETTSSTTTLNVPSLDGLDYVQVDVTATDAPVQAWDQPVVLHFRRQADGWQWVGLVRQP